MVGLTVTVGGYAAMFRVMQNDALAQQRFQLIGHGFFTHGEIP